MNKKRFKPRVRRMIVGSAAISAAVLVAFLTVFRSSNADSAQTMANLVLVVQYAPDSGMLGTFSLEDPAALETLSDGTAEEPGTPPDASEETADGGTDSREDPSAADTEAPADPTGTPTAGDGTGGTPTQSPDPGSTPETESAETAEASDPAAANEPQYFLPGAQRPAYFEAESGNADYLSGNWSELDRLYNGATGSFQSYLSTISCGKLHVVNYFPQADGREASAMQVFTLSKQKDEYSANTVESGIIGELIGAFQDGTLTMPAGKMDNLESGILDNLTIILVGSDNGDGDSPHKAVYPGDGTVSGLLVRNYNVLPSDQLMGEGALFGGRGLIAHEFLHSCGFTDLYHYNNSLNPIGAWDIMASTSKYYNYPLSFFRAQRGWVSMATASSAGHYTLNAASAGGSCVLKLTTPLNTDEFFCIEYRIKKDSIAQADALDTKIPGTGLVIYRINQSIAGGTNNMSDGPAADYAYVFRPAGASESSAAPALEITSTASYGSTDLAASKDTDDLIYYADGTNSGIKISNMALSQDGESVSFDVSLADYSADENLWTLLGPGAITSSQIAKVAVAGDSDVYAAYSDEYDANVTVKVYQNNAWSQVGDTVSDCGSPQLAVFGGSVYLGGVKGDGSAVFYKLNGSRWELIDTDSAHPYCRDIAFFADDSLYAGYVSNNDTQVIFNVVNRSVVTTDQLPGGYIVSPGMCKSGDSIYLLYSNFNGTNHATTLAKYSVSSGTWDGAFHVFSTSGTKAHHIAASGGKLYALVGGDNMQPVYSTFDNTSWTSEAVTGAGGYLDTNFLVNGGAPVFILNSNSATSPVVKAFYRSASGWEQYGSDVFSSASAIDAALIDGKITVVGGSGNGSAAVRYKSAPSATDPEQPADDYTVTVTPPGGYADTTLWIDGNEYAAIAQNGALSAVAPDGSKKVVEMYAYNQNGIPIGMSVWMLRFTGGAYTATPVPALTDLLTYHGFSVRITGISGIRFKTGISTVTRDALTGAGLDGYRLQEYGTVVMRDENRGQYPFIKGGTGTAFGRAYWIENGVVNDFIFETKDGRHRFTSVLVDLAVEKYKTDYAFRGYILLAKDGDTFLIYGPPVARSIYRVSQQVLDSGEFAAGSASDLYLRNVIAAADALS